MHWSEGIFGNSWTAYGWFAGILLCGLLLRKYLSQALSWLAYRLLKNYTNGQVGFQRFLTLLRRPVSLFIIIVTLYLALDRLCFPEEWHIAPAREMGIRKILLKVFQSSIILSFTWIILRFTDFMGLVFMYKASLTASKTDDQVVPFVKEAFKIIIGTVSVFFVLGFVFHLNITSLIAGLGIGGIAIALAAKETLENLIGSLTIFMDKPFVVGDLVKVGAIEGNIEKIGFRSTRIRTLEKSFVTMPNKKMVDTEMENLTLRTIRRIKFNFSIKYGTDPETVKSITQKIAAFISTHPMNHEIPQVYFYELGSFAMEIRVIYFANTNEWDLYMHMKEDVNYFILNVLKTEGCELAYPTQQIILKQDATDHAESVMNNS